MEQDMYLPEGEEQVEMTFSDLTTSQKAQYAGLVGFGISKLLIRFGLLPGMLLYSMYKLKPSTSLIELVLPFPSALPPQ
ncbi:mitochondrial hypothetical protein [Andalucia godoyi]|uniref:Uncharacterized protein n=1 Tax=Andalucia godoyi TaxID=505711 RepID=A0A8K0AGT7_ANDGO|nr:mitochondrial hypothetical protein [Andalucia godoyi]|eukprot:ANDGO_00862.mRNA.1 mitochondrial hypothetical protein